MATKRANPFIEDFMPQSKIHVGLKQFNNNEDRLKKVYDKTLELLFKGAKKTSYQENLSLPNGENVFKKDSMKQLVIGKDGSLVNSRIKIEEKLSAVEKCSCGKAMEANCGYCERVLCPNCLLYCIHCDKNFCSQCSLLGEDGDVICVSCYN